MSRLIAGVTLGIAFLIMASIITPHDTTASDKPGNIHTDNLPSTDPHYGLPSMGSIESLQYIVEMYRTDVGPRYSVRNREDGEIIATLRTAKQIEQEFPDIPLAKMDFSHSATLMMVDPNNNWDH